MQCNVLFLSVFGVEIAVKNERKRVSRTWENAYLSIKNPKVSRTHLSGPWTPATNGSLPSLDSTLLHQQLSASEAGPPPLDKILDPHLRARPQVPTKIIDPLIYLVGPLIINNKVIVRTFVHSLIIIRQQAQFKTFMCCGNSWDEAEKLFSHN